MILFADTEFNQRRADDDPRLISIGVVDESGTYTFYAELSDTYTSDDLTDFVCMAVFPLLEGGSCQMTFNELKERLGAWILSFNQPVQIAVDSLAADWTWIHEIFSEQGSWPENLNRHPVLLTTNYLVDYDKFLAGVEQGFKSGLRRHHSLDDAKANRVGFLAAGGLWSVGSGS